MNHPSEDELALHYYGETPNEAEIDSHLEECPECRALWASLRRTLDAAKMAPVPERGADYGAEVWRKIETRVKLPGQPAQARRHWLEAFGPLIAILTGNGARRIAVGMALLVAAFLAGQNWTGRSGPGPTSLSANHTPISRAARERILLAEIGEHLERSQQALIELIHSETNETVDITLEKDLARQLVGVNRLYRRAAGRLGDAGPMSVLDDLERVLMEISNSPDNLTPEEYAAIRQRLEGDDLLFRIKVLGARLREPAPLTVSSARG